ncbi:MAG: cytochrome C peroxidase [Woeseiaceae bacterium]|nr:cytochrome C peroxidase [Woeseiaceae bacterium]
MDRKSLYGLIFIAHVLSGCGDDENNSAGAAPPPDTGPAVQNSVLDDQLRALIADNNLSGDPGTGRTIPAITDPIVQLGKKLFYTKALGGDFDSACASCHHPVLGGADALSLSFGVGAIDPDLLGPGRGDVTGIPNVPRNAPTTFNMALWDAGLFWDSRVESLGKEPGANGAASGISTPDSGSNVIDSQAGANLAVAQARFPVTSTDEMRGALQAGASNDVLRAHLAGRLGNYGAGAGELAGSRWLEEFQTAFASAEDAASLITFDNIVAALGAFERSQVFVANPWRDYVQGDNLAISDDAKRGAILFYTPVENDGAGCVECHSGDLFSDQGHHAIAAPQFGPGKGNPGNNDFGRENISGDSADRFRFRTPSLLNVSVSAPYMHSGAYQTLQQVLRHYDNPDNAVEEFFAAGGWCSLPQFQGVQNCEALYPSAQQNSNAALNKVAAERRQNDPAALPNANLNNGERNQIIAFLATLTDPCVEDRQCLAPWIPAPGEAADEHQLNAVNINGDTL